MIYGVYQSKYNKESLDTLKYGFTLSEFLVHRDYVTELDEYEYAVNLDQEIKMKNK